MIIEVVILLIIRYKISFLEMSDNPPPIEFFVINQTEDFKKNVCIPYFKDIYKVFMFITHK